MTDNNLHLPQDQDQDQESNMNIDLDLENLPFLFKMMQKSKITNLVYEYIIKQVVAKSINIDLLKNKNSIKYVTLGICALFATSLVCMLSYFLFYVMFFCSSLKCILWLFEHYNPGPIDTTSNINPDILEHYVSDPSPSDVLEYYIIPIFMGLVMYPLAYIPIPFLPLIVYGTSVVLSLACLTEKSYRQRLCLFIRDTFVSDLSRDDDGSYIPGHEGEFHKLLQTICYTIDCIHMSTYNLTHNPKKVSNQLNTIDNIIQAFGVISSNLSNIADEVVHTRPRSNNNMSSKQNKQNKQNNKKNNSRKISKKPTNDDSDEGVGDSLF